MVMNVGLAKAGDWDAVTRDIRAVSEARKDGGALLKVILETCLLTKDEIVKACEASMKARADYVKTSTGFHPAGGASVHAVEVMRAAVGPTIGVKASGGIRTADFAAELIAAGASRLGLSGTRSVLAGFPE